jgi:hypothetical protein
MIQWCFCFTHSVNFTHQQEVSLSLWMLSEFGFLCGCNQTFMQTTIPLWILWSSLKLMWAPCVCNKSRLLVVYFQFLNDCSIKLLIWIRYVIPRTMVYERSFLIILFQLFFGEICRVFVVINSIRLIYQ